MNKTQRLILAVIVPLVVLSIAQEIMEIDTAGYWGGSPSWFDEQVWWGWAITFAVIGVFEYFLFRDGRKE